MVDYFYMCLVFNNKSRTYISPPRFFQSIFAARIYSISHAKIHILNNELYINYACIYKVYYDDDFEIENNLHIEMYRDRGTLSAILIQKQYRKHFKRRFKAIVYLQNALKRAITNPRTELCKKRLLREFNVM